MSPDSAPAGFVRHDRPSPMTDPWQPLHRRIADGTVVLGLEIREAHCNGRYFMHGGLITTLADNAMGLSVLELKKKQGGSPAHGVTLNLSVDFIRRGEIGDWVEFRPRIDKLGRTISLVGCEIVANGDQVLARASASYLSTAS